MIKITEEPKNLTVRFKDIEIGQVFKTTYSHYIKIRESIRGITKINAVKLVSGETDYFLELTMVSPAILLAKTITPDAYYAKTTD